MTGYTSITTNIGKTQNKGLEITLSTTNIQTKDLHGRLILHSLLIKKKLWNWQEERLMIQQINGL